MFKTKYMLENSINYEKCVVTHKDLGLFSSLSICYGLGLMIMLVVLSSG